MNKPVLGTGFRQFFFFLAKFRPETYDFELYKMFSMEKVAKISQISIYIYIYIPDRQIFMISFRR